LQNEAAIKLLYKTLNQLIDFKYIAHFTYGLKQILHI